MGIGEKLPEDEGGGEAGEYTESKRRVAKVREHQQMYRRWLETKEEGLASQSQPPSQPLSW